MAHSTDDLLSDAVRQLFTAQCTPQVVRAIEAGKPAQPLWQLIEASGFADALVSEAQGGAQGGAGLSLPAVYPVLELCGAFALPVPLAETMLARALLAQAGVAVPPGMNEGWATFWHHKLLNTLYDDGHLSDGTMLEWLRDRKSVV